MFGDPTQTLELSLIVIVPILIILPILYMLFFNIFTPHKKRKVCKEMFAGYHSQIYKQSSETDLKLLEMTVKNTIRNSVKRLPRRKLKSSYSTGDIFLRTYHSKPVKNERHVMFCISETP